MCLSTIPRDSLHHDHESEHAAPAAGEGRSGLVRRAFFKLGGAAAAGAGPAVVAPAMPAPASRKGNRPVADLTHRLATTFPSFAGPQVVFDQVQFTVPDNGFSAKQWTFAEHIGTHVDTSGHFSLGMAPADELDPQTLIASIAVVGIRDRAAEDPNATIEPDDLLAYGRRHGRIPRGALACMNSGWEAEVDDGDAFLGGTGFRISISPASQATPPTGSSPIATCSASASTP